MKDSKTMTGIFGGMLGLISIIGGSLMWLSRLVLFTLVGHAAWRWQVWSASQRWARLLSGSAIVGVLTSTALTLVLPPGDWAFRSTGLFWLLYWVLPPAGAFFVTVVLEVVREDLAGEPKDAKRSPTR